MKSTSRCAWIWKVELEKPFPQPRSSVQRVEEITAVNPNAEFEKIAAAFPVFRLAFNKTRLTAR